MLPHSDETSGDRHAFAYQWLVMLIRHIRVNPISTLVKQSAVGRTDRVPEPGMETIGPDTHLIAYDATDQFVRKLRSLSKNSRIEIGGRKGQVTLGYCRSRPNVRGKKCPYVGTDQFMRKLRRNQDRRFVRSGQIELLPIVAECAGKME